MAGGNAPIKPRLEAAQKMIKMGKALYLLVKKRKGVGGTLSAKYYAQYDDQLWSYL